MKPDFTLSINGIPVGIFKVKRTSRGLPAYRWNKGIFASQNRDNFRIFQVFHFFLKPREEEIKKLIARKNQYRAMVKAINRTKNI